MNSKEFEEKCSSVENSIHNLRGEMSVLHTLSSKYKTLEHTLLNLTQRLRMLELDVHPECPRCGQRLPELKNAMKGPEAGYGMAGQEVYPVCREEDMLKRREDAPPRVVR